MFWVQCGRCVKRFSRTSVAKKKKNGLFSVRSHARRVSKGRASFTSAADTLQPVWPGPLVHWEPRRADLFTDGPLTREDLNTLERNDEREREKSATTIAAVGWKSH